MTVNDAIERSAVLYPAELDADKTYLFLSDIESRIRTELYGEEAVLFTQDDGNTPLKADGAYGQIYPIYIAKERELSAGDADRYSFLNSVFEALYSDYANSINRAKKQGEAVYIKTV